MTVKATVVLEWHDERLWVKRSSNHLIVKPGEQATWDDVEDWLDRSVLVIVEGGKPRQKKDHEKGGKENDDAEVS